MYVMTDIRRPGALGWFPRGKEDDDDRDVRPPDDTTVSPIAPSAPRRSIFDSIIAKTRQEADSFAEQIISSGIPPKRSFAESILDKTRDTARNVALTRQRRPTRLTTVRKVKEIVPSMEISPVAVNLPVVTSIVAPSPKPLVTNAPVTPVVMPQYVTIPEEVFAPPTYTVTEATTLPTTEGIGNIGKIALYGIAAWILYDSFKQLGKPKRRRPRRIRR